MFFLQHDDVTTYVASSLPSVQERVWHVLPKAIKIMNENILKKILVEQQIDFVGQGILLFNILSS